MNGKEEIPNTNPTEDDTFKALKRISFHGLMSNMKMHWIDDGVISILRDNMDWGELNTYIHHAGWTREEFIAECIKRKESGEYTYEKYINRLK